MASEPIDEPINILAGLVIASANDVLAGYQTWEEHIKYLRDAAKEQNLPLDLTEERNTDENLPLYRRPALPQPPRTDRRAVSTQELPDNVPSLRTRNLFD